MRRNRNDTYGNPRWEMFDIWRRTYMNLHAPESHRTLALGFLRKYGLVLLVCAALIGALRARAQQVTASNVTTPKVTIKTTPEIPQVTRAYVQTSQGGTNNYWYWIVTKDSAGNASLPAGPWTASDVAQPSSAAPITVSWQSVGSGYTYDLLRTTTATAPSGTSSLAIATGIASATYTDENGTPTSYTVSSQALPCIETMNGLTLQSCGAAAASIVGTGTGAPTGACLSGTYYINSTNSSLYFCDNSTWISEGTPTVVTATPTTCNNSPFTSFIWDSTSQILYYCSSASGSPASIGSAPGHGKGSSGGGAGGGSVTSVGFTADGNLYCSGGSPVTTSGNLSPLACQGPPDEVLATNVAASGTNVTFVQWALCTAGIGTETCTLYNFAGGDYAIAFNMPGTSGSNGIATAGTDSLGNVWSIGPASLSAYIGTTSATSGTLTITFNVNGGGVQPLGIAEFSGSSGIDAAGIYNNTCSTNPCTLTNSITTTASNDAIFAVGTENGGSFSDLNFSAPSANFLFYKNSLNYVAAAFYGVNAAGTYSQSFTGSWVNGSNFPGLQLFAFKESASSANSVAHLRPLLAVDLPNIERDYYTTNLTAAVSMPANTPTDVLTLNLHMPSVGCPCTVTYNYGVIFATSSALIIKSVVSDGTNLAAGGGFNTTGSLTDGAFNGSGNSQVTYSDGQAVTVNLVVEGNAAFTVNYVSPTYATGYMGTWLQAITIPLN